MTEEQVKQCNELIFGQIAKDGEFVDNTAKQVGINQRIVYRAFILFHQEVYRKMYEGREE